MSNFSHEFLKFALDREVLRFGEFKTKAGRLSPYFFNSGLFKVGNDFIQLGEFYAKAILSSGIQFDVLFGPAYKGIPIVVATAMALAKKNVDVPISFNRKETKTHGEKGDIIGNDLSGRVLLLDDVISAGTSINESNELIMSNGGRLAGACVALDRMEQGNTRKSAIQEVEEKLNIQVIAIANLENLVSYLGIDIENQAKLKRVREYRDKYGI